MFEIDATNLPRFMACNGSVRMGGLLPPVSSDNTVRDEGNAAHYMALAVFNNEFTIDELIDRRAPNGIYMTVDMATHVSDYMDTVLNRALTPRCHMEVDTSFGFNEWQVNARADFVSLTHDGRFLYIDDLKYGWRPVEPFKNWTLIAHAIGHIIRTKCQPLEIVFTIHQPRPLHQDGPVREWRVTYRELMELYQELSSTLANPRDELNTSSFCDTCRANPSCPAARKAQNNAIEASETIFDDKIDNATLAFNLDMLNRGLEMIKSRLEAFEELALHRVSAGQVIDRYAVETKYGHTTWKPGITPVVMNAITGKDLSIGKLVTPAEAKRRGVSEAIIKPFTDRPVIGKKLVRSDAHKRAEKLLGKGT